MIFFYSDIFDYFDLLTTVILLMCKIKCNARDNKADIKNNTQHFDISGEHKTNSESSVFKTKSQNQLRIKCIQGKITKPTQNQVYSSQNQHHIPDTKKADIKNNTPAMDALVKITINTALKFVTNNLTL